MYFQDATPYKLLRRIDYPYEFNDEIRWERLMYEKLRTFVSEASQDKKYMVRHNVEIPLSKIMPYVSDCCSSIDKLELVQIKLNNIYYLS